MAQHIIKSRRRFIILKIGDSVLDNGKCYQLVSRASFMPYQAAPLINKQEFKKFISLPEVSINTDHNYDGCTLYTYYGEATE
jgi:hypothetical protein